MTSTPRFGLVQWEAGTLNQDVLHNTLTVMVDIFLAGGVKSRTTDAQPGAPTEGDCYIITATPSGAVWAGFTENYIAYYFDGAWTEYAPPGRFLTYVDDEATFIGWNGSAYANFVVTNPVSYDDTDISSAAWVLDEDNMASNSDQKVPTQQSVKAYVDASVVGLFDDKGNYNAATNTPDLDTSPSASIKKGDVYTVSVAGTFFTEAVEIGDTLRAMQDAPTALAHWTRGQTNLVNAIVDGDFTAAEGLMRKSGAGTYTLIKTNLTAIVPPTITDDSSAGYGVGSLWTDTVKNIAYICTDASVGAAKWSAGGAGLTPVFVTGASYNANPGEAIFCDSTLNAITITLPATPDDKDNILVIDSGGAANTYNITIGRNGETIDGVAADFVIDQAYGQVNLAYDNGNTDWKVALVGTPSLVEAQINALTSGRKTKYFRMDKDMRVGLTQNPSAEVTIGGAAGVGQHVARSFDGTAVEYVLFDWMAPENYDEAWGFAFIPVWSATTTDVGNAVFELRPKAHANNGAIAGGHTANTNYSIDGSLGTADTALYGPESSPMTTGGINKGELVNFRFQRFSTDAADTLNGIDINIIGCILVWHTDAPTED